MVRPAWQGKVVTVAFKRNAYILQAGLGVSSQCLWPFIRSSASLGPYPGQVQGSANVTFYAII